LLSWVQHHQQSEPESEPSYEARLMDVRFLSLPIYTPGQICRNDHFSDSNSGPTSVDEVRFLVRITGIPRQIFGGDPFLGQLFRTRKFGRRPKPVTGNPATGNKRSALRLAPIASRTAVRARTRPNDSMTAPRHHLHWHRENIGDFRFPQRFRSAAQGLPRQHANMRTRLHRHHAI